ncbi:MAG TPA: mechanosensitive ion channel family protein [bacterium]
MSFFDTTFYHNTIKEWIVAVSTLAISFTVLRILKAVIAHRLHVLSLKTQIGFDDLIVELLRKVKFLSLLVVSIYVGALAVTLPPKVDNIIRIILIVTVLWQAATWGNALIVFFIKRYRQQKLETDAASVTTISALGFVAKLALWTVILLLALDNVGVNITGLVAGLGISGIAVALAVQNILGDLFASMSIALDQPFVIGDFVIVDEYMGTVQKIGLKTTRIQSLSGEQLIFSNSDLLNSRIRNYKRMSERRIAFGLGVIYQTSYDQLVAIPKIITEIIGEQQRARLDRVHFKDYGESSLNFEIVYYVASPDYNVYMDIQQDINLKIFRRFADEGIEFAYPTQTLFLNADANGEVVLLTKGARKDSINGDD